MKIIVIGAGASGLMAAGIAAKNGNEVLILEKNDRAGRKILISGKGRCNVTNAMDIGDFIEQVPGNGNFLYSAFYTFTNEDMINLLSDFGVKTKVERGGRVFPESDKSSDVVNALMKMLNKYNVKIRYNSSVKEIIAKDNEVEGVELQTGEKLFCDRVILATGGMSYPGTGSTGDGYIMAKKLGHNIVPLKPSLVGLITNEDWVYSLQGLSLKNVAIKLTDEKNKAVYEDMGEMLFTHFGVSGPIILSGSRAIHKYMDEKLRVEGIKLKIDLKPALSNEKLDLRIQRDFAKYINKQFKNALDDLLPEKLIPVVINLSKIEPTKQVNSITKEERQRLVEILKNLTLTVTELRPVKEAIVTAGGIDIKEINSSTMESKLVKNLYFCGEIIDVDAYTGGFNLQIAFSTGYLAGMQ